MSSELSDRKIMKKIRRYVRSKIKKFENLISRNSECFKRVKHLLNKLNDKNSINIKFDDSTIINQLFFRKIGNPLLYDLFLKHGANPNIPDEKGNTPTFLIYMPDYNKVAILNLLIKYKADVNLQNNKGKTPLHLACSKNNERIVKILIDNRAKLNAQDNKENTPLHYAVFELFSYNLETILKNGADPNIPDNEGHYPLYYLINNNNIYYDNISTDEVISIMLYYGAKINFEFEHLNFRQNVYDIDFDENPDTDEANREYSEKIKELLRNHPGNDSFKLLCYRNIISNGFSFENLPKNFFK